VSGSRANWARRALAAAAVVAFAMPATVWFLVGLELQDYAWPFIVSGGTLALGGFVVARLRKL
jgi:hypothetical protein